MKVEKVRKLNGFENAAQTDRRTALQTLLYWTLRNLKKTYLQKTERRFPGQS